MSIESAVGQVVQMLVVWVPIVLLYVAILRVLWRAGGRNTSLNQVLAGQQRLQGQIDVLAHEVRDLASHVRGTGSP